MSRTNDVNIAMQYAKSGVDGVHLMDSHKATIGWVVNTLAAEVERLEAELAKSDEAARAAMYALDERAFLAECSETSEKRAEAAEARVAELEERLKGTLQAGGYQYFYEQLHAAEREAGNARYVAEQAQAKVAELEAQIAEVVGSQRNEDKSLPTWAQVMNRVALLTEQNARLREQVAELIAKELSNPVLRQIDNALAAAKPGEVVHLPGGSYFFGFTGKALNGEEANK